VTSGTGAEKATDADKTLVRRFLDAWSDGDLDAAFALTDPNGTVWMLSFGQELRMGDWTERIRAKAANLQRGTRYVIDQMTAEAGRVSVLADGSSVLGNGSEYANRYHFLFEVADGRIVRCMEFSDPRVADAAFRGGKRTAFHEAS
jgi:ketosteroid isomerase-like protein